MKPEMTESTAPFNYQAMRENELRVIKIRRGSWGGPIICELQHITLQAESPPDFVALSYVWGEQNVLQQITLNGHTFPVGVNLHAALCRIRQMDLDRPIWIDAICINQKDKDEINIEVRRMGLIYSSAKVLAFLGENSAEDDIIIGNIFRVAKQLVGPLSSVDEYAKFIDKCNRRPLVDKLEIEDPQFMDQARMFLTSFLGREWFFRIWTFQEICLPQQIPDIMCGSHVISLIDLGIFWAAMLSSFKAPADHLVYIRARQLHQIASNRGQAAEPGRPENFPGQLMSILQEVHGRKASEPRDMIYGTLGMIKDNIHKLPPSLEPNIKLHFENVYREYSKFLFEQTGCLSLMVTTENHLQYSPTWVPDFRYLGPNRTPDARSKVSFSDDGTMMCVQGFLVDEVAGFIGRRDFPINPTSTGAALNMFKDTILEKGAQIRGISTMAMVDVWLRPILEMQHRFQNWQGSGGSSRFENLYAKYRECYHYLTTNPDNLPSDLNEHMKLLNGLVRQAQFLTSSGKLGVLQRRNMALAEKDLICFFKGSVCESILRPAEDGCFSFLGTCQMMDTDPLDSYGASFFLGRPIRKWWLV